MNLVARVLLGLIVNAQVCLVFVCDRVVITCHFRLRLTIRRTYVRIVIGVITYDELLRVIRPFPVEKIIENNEKLFAAGLAAYDVEEKVEAEV